MTNHTPTSGPRPAVEDLLRPALVVCSLGAAAIHLATAGEHDPLFGLAFLLMAGFQAGWAVAVILVRSRLVLLGGVAGQGAIVATWLAAHTSGLPFGPGAGRPEPIGFKDITATVLELVAIGGALLLLRPDAARRLRDARPPRAGTPLALGAAVFLAAAAVMTPHAHGPRAHGQDPAAAHGHDAGDDHAPGDDHGNGDDHPDGDDHADGSGHADGEDHPDGDESGGTDHGHGEGHRDGDDGDAGHGDGQGGHDEGGDPGPGEGEPARVVAGPFAEATGYAEPTVEVEVGGRLTFGNFDFVAHDVVHDVAADGFGGSADMPWCAQTHHSDGACPVFWSPTVEAGESTPVLGMNNVEPGRSYSFFCTLHHTMTGTLVVR